MNKISSLDELRGLAILTVVFSHFTGGLVPVQISLFLGNFGVIVFFFLSGFLMDKNLARDPRTIPFAIRRAFRILPMYWVSIVINAAAENSWSLTQIASNATFTAMPLGIDRLSGVYWTLYIEVAFYSIAPLLRHLGENAIRLSPIVFAALVAIFVKTTALPFYMVFCFAGMQFGSLHRRRKSALLSVATALTIIIVAHRFSDIFWYLTISETLGLLLLATATKHELGFSILRLCGNVSYSWYLLHTIIGVYLAEFLLSHGMGGWFEVAVSFLLSFFASLMTFNAIEQPSIELGKKLSSLWSGHYAPNDASLPSR